MFLAPFFPHTGDASVAGEGREVAGRMHARGLVLVENGSLERVHVRA